MGSTAGLDASYLHHEAQTFLKSQPILGWSRNSLHFMELEDSLPHLQEPVLFHC
jgi:hypothetical protein